MVMNHDRCKTLAGLPAKVLPAAEHPNQQRKMFVFSQVKSQEDSKKDSMFRATAAGFLPLGRHHSGMMVNKLGVHNILVALVPVSPDSFLFQPTSELVTLYTSFFARTSIVVVQKVGTSLLSFPITRYSMV